MSAIVKSKPIRWEYVTPIVAKDHYILHHGFHGTSKVVGFYASEERRKEVAVELLKQMIGSLPEGSTEYDNRRYQMGMSSLLSNPIINAAANQFIHIQQLAMALGPRGTTWTI